MVNVRQGALVARVNGASRTPSTTPAPPERGAGRGDLQGHHSYRSLHAWSLTCDGLAFLQGARRVLRGNKEENAGSRREKIPPQGEGRGRTLGGGRF